MSDICASTPQPTVLSMMGVSVYRRFRDHRLPSLITTNVADRAPLLANPDAAAALEHALVEARDELRFELLAWVIMPDHMHLVVQLPDRVSSDSVMRLVKGRFSRRWNHRRRAGGPLWQTRFHERVLTSERALLAAVEYVHANPVVAGLVDVAGDYEWSSARAWSVRSQAEPSSGNRLRRR